MEKRVQVKLGVATPRVHLAASCPRSATLVTFARPAREAGLKRRAIAALLLMGACRKTTTEIPVNTAPAPVDAPAAAVVNTPRAAVDAFMGAIKAQDLQALSLAWGDKDGPIRDSKKMTRDDLEKREIVLLRCLKFDKYRLLSDAAAADNERVMAVEITSGTQTRVADFFTAKGADRWFVRYVPQACPTK
jgi:hypothetical protein